MILKYSEKKIFEKYWSQPIFDVYDEETILKAATIYTQDQTIHVNLALTFELSKWGQHPKACMSNCIPTVY